MVGKVIASILAGGKSQRMGQDKALMAWQGRPLLAHMLDIPKAMGIPARIIADREDLDSFGVVVLQDRMPEAGPAAAVWSALASDPEATHLILACDMPQLEPSLPAELLSLHASGITLPKDATGWHPLCAVYDGSLGSDWEHAVRAGERRMQALVRSFPHQVVDMSRYAHMLHNWNQPEDIPPS